MPDISQYLAVRALKLPRPNLIHGFHILPLGAVAAYLAHEMGVPFLATAQGDDVNVYPKLNRRNGRVLRAVAQTAEKIFATGATLAATTQRLMGVPVENLPIGVSPPRFENLPAKAEARAQLGLPVDRTIALYVGRLVPGKGIEELATALNAVRDTRLLGVVIGAGPLQSEFLRCDNAICLGPKLPADVTLAMAAADFLVLPSHSEGLPTVLMEAAFAKLPIITTDAPGCIDLGADGRALMVPIGDAGALATAFRTAVSQPDTMQMCASRMLIYAQENCSLERNTQRLIDHYRAAMSARSG
jgi:teichuronic acid biosynthesis glycosyltransferase TuaC